VSAKPIRWHMPQLLSIAAVLGVFSIVETFGLLLIGIRVLSHPHLQDYFGLTSEDQLQAVMAATGAPRNYADKVESFCANMSLGDRSRDTQETSAP
jgi:hypothetical protein